MTNHVQEAVKHIGWVHDQQEAEGEFHHSTRDNALIAQAEATLALVEQQRIANTIALGRVWESSDYPSLDAVMPLLRPDIAAALGIEGA